MLSDPFVALGEYLTTTEAEGLAVLLETDQHTAHALRSINPARREQAKTLLDAAGLSHTDAARAVSVLRAITPVWTMPGNEAKIGHLTSEFHRLVQAARQAVTCATYNFETTSQMWIVLKDASEQPGVVVTVYVDGDKADAAKVKAQLPRATIYQSKVLPNGKQ